MIIFSLLYFFIVAYGLFTVKYTPQWMWLREEFKRVDREKTPWLIVLMHVPIYNSNEAHFMEGESMRSVYESWFVHYKVDVIFAGHVHAYERSVCCLIRLLFLHLLYVWTKNKRSLLSSKQLTK